MVIDRGDLPVLDTHACWAYICRTAGGQRAEAMRRPRRSPVSRSDLYTRDRSRPCSSSLARRSSSMGVVRIFPLFFPSFTVIAANTGRFLAMSNSRSSSSSVIDLRTNRRPLCSSIRAMPENGFLVSRMSPVIRDFLFVTRFPVHQYPNAIHTSMYPLMTDADRPFCSCCTACNQEGVPETGICNDSILCYRCYLPTGRNVLV